MPSVEEAEAYVERAQRELRLARLNHPDFRARITEKMEEAKKLADDTSMDYQYSGPTMHSHSHGSLASCIRSLRSIISDLLFLAENQ